MLNHQSTKGKVLDEQIIKKGDTKISLALKTENVMNSVVSSTSVSTKSSVQSMESNNEIDPLDFELLEYNLESADEIFL